LFYPKRDTWLGSTNPDVVDEFSETMELITEKVEQKMIDDYLPQISNLRTLFKIDVEGNEISVEDFGEGATDRRLRVPQAKRMEFYFLIL
jgi:hypothetical protein